MYVVKLKDKETGVYKIKYKKDITLSKFIPKGLGSVINTIPDDNYVLGVCYNNDNQIYIVTGHDGQALCFIFPPKLDQ